MPPLLVVSACHRSEPEPLPVWASPPPAYVPREGSDSAFDAYVLAALEVEAAAEQAAQADLAERQRKNPKAQIDNFLYRVSFTPGQRESVRALAAPGVEQVIRASRNRCEFAFTPRAPFTNAPYQKGWRLIGKALRWEVDAAAEKGNFDRAVELTLAATRFGFAIAGGGSTEASLGYSIVDDARGGISPYLDDFGARQLSTLAEGLEAALDRRPALREVVEHERASARLAIQAIQDAWEKNQLEAFETALGGGVRDAVVHLRDLKREELPEYFKAFAAGADEDADRLIKALEANGTKRAEILDFKPKGKPKWRLFAKHFVGTARPLIEISDRSVARTRMLALASLVIRQRKLQQSLPKSLEAFPKLNVDPFNGSPLHYVVDGTDFRLYSVGPNLLDDGGESDEAGLSPDVTLETLAR